MLPLYIENYEKLENKCNIQQFITFNKLFSKLDKYKIYQSNAVENNELFNCIELVPIQRKIIDDSLDEEIYSKIDFIYEQKNRCLDDLKLQEFYKGYISLLKYSKFLEPSEQLILNFFFMQIIKHNKDFSPVVGSNEKFKISDR